MPLLPAELLLLIVDAVSDCLWNSILMESRSDPRLRLRFRSATLSACALTCRAMRKQSQSHLFYDVSLAQHIHYLRFAQAVDLSPHLASHVKRMTLVLEDSHADDLPLPPHVIARLTNVKALMLRTSESVCDISPMFYTMAMIFAASCSSLQDLSLSRFKFPSFASVVRLVWSFPSIRSVMLAMLTWEEPSGGIPSCPELYPGRCSNLKTFAVCERRIDLMYTVLTHSLEFPRTYSSSVSPTGTWISLHACGELKSGN